MAKRVNTPFVSVVGGVCLVLVVGFFAGPYLKAKILQPAIPKQVASLTAEADKAVKEGRYLDAKEAINKAWRLDPTNKELCIKLGDMNALLVQEDGPIAMEHARASWENALAIDPSYKPALQRLLNSYIEQLEVRPTPEACLHLRDAATRSFQLDPTDQRAKSYIYIATVQQWVQGMPGAKEQHTQAIENLDKLQKEDPSSPDVLFYLVRGRTFQSAQDYAGGHADTALETVNQCRGLLDAAVAKYPKNAALSFRVFQGYVMLMDAGHDPDQIKKDHVSADAALARARTTVKPDDQRYDDFQYVASDWARRNGHLDEAEKILREFYDLRKNDQRVRLALCRVLALTGDPAKRDEAIDILKMQMANGTSGGVKTVGKKELEAQTLLDLTSMRVAKYPTVDPAKRADLMKEIDAGFEKVDKLAIADAIPVLRLKGLIAQLKGQNVEAVGALSRAMVLLEHSDPNNPIKFDLMYQLATVERLAQQNKAAEKWLVQIVERFDGYSPARFQLADLYLEENNLQEAAKHIEVLARQKPSSPDVIRLEVMLNQRAGKMAEAKSLTALLPEARFEEKLAKAQMAANLRDYPTAIRLLVDMQKEHPEDTGITVALYQAYAKGDAGQQTLGKKALADALKLHPKDPRLQLAKKQSENASAIEIEKLIDELSAQSGDPFFQKIRDARKALGAGNMAEALARTQEADQIRRNDPASWDLFFNIYMQQQNWKMADQAVENLTRLNADQAGGRMYRWKYYMGRGEYNDAISAARDLTVIRDNFGQSWILLGQAYQASGQFIEAVKEYQAALERQTTNIDAYKGLADCYDAQSDPDRALETVTLACRLFPDSVYMRERRLGYIGQNNPQAVVPERQKLLDENPDEPENYLAMASACVQAAQKVYAQNPQTAAQYTETARDVLTKGVGKFPDHLRLNGALADAMQNSGKSDAGVKILQDLAALPVWKDKPEPLLLLGEYYARSKKPADAVSAESAFREAWAKGGKKNIDIELRIVALLEEQKSYDKCLAVLASNASDPRIARQTLQVHIAAGHTAEALKGLNEAIAQSPNDVNLLNLLAVVDIDGTRFKEAREVLVKALSLDPRNDVSLYYQALVELRDALKGNLDLALRNLATVVTRNPRNVQFRLESAGAKVRVRDTEGAATDLEEALRYEPYNRDARLRLLDLYTQTKKWAKFEQVVTFAELNPVISEGVWFRAHAYALAAQERYPEAVQKIREAIAIDPQNAVFARDYLIILLQSKDTAGVIRETDRLVQNGHHEWWVYHIRGLARFAAGNKSDALEQLDKAMGETQNPDDYQQVLTSMADISVDEALARLASKIDGNDRWRLQSVQLRMRKSEFALALTELDPILKNRAKLPREERLAAVRLAAECYQSSGDPKTSKQFYLEWLAESPNDSTALNNFAYLLAEDLNQPDEAKKYSLQAYDAGRKLNYTDPLIVDTHGWVLVLCGGNDANSGLSILRSLVDAHGDFIDARYHLAIGYLKRNRPADAVEQLNTAMDQIKALEAKGQTVRPVIKANIQKALDKATSANPSAR